MGKGLAFLNLKFFHPGNKENQRRKWEALQRDAERQRKVKEREAELNQEKQLHETRKMLFEQELGADSNEYRKELKKEQIAWIYNAPPGLKKQIEKERAKVEEEKRLKEWQQAMSSMTREERRFAEKEMENGLSVHERNVRRFEFLKNAPMVADYVKNMEVTHKPFGKLIRNVRCIKCGKWGHRIYDRECEMNEYNPYDQGNSNVKAEMKENKHDPLYHIKSKLLNKHLERYKHEDEDKDKDKDKDVETHGHVSEDMDIIDMKSQKKKKFDTQSVFTLNPDEGSVNANMYQVKSFEGNDGTKFELIHEVKKLKGKKCVHKRRKDVDVDEDVDEDYKFIMSLDKEKQMELLKEIEKREKKRKKKKKKKKHRKRRYRSRSRSRSRSRDRRKNKRSRSRSR